MATEPMNVDLDMPTAMKSVVLNVTLKRQMQATLRLWIAAQIIKFAAWIGGFGGVEFEKDA